MLKLFYLVYSVRSYLNSRTAIPLLILPFLCSCNKNSAIEFNFDNLKNAEIVQVKPWFLFARDSHEMQNITFKETRGKVSAAQLEYSINAFSSAKERELFYLKSIYQRSTPPYAGAVQVKEECPSDFLPFVFQEIDENDRRSFGFVARGTEREKYGACDKLTAKKTFIKVLIDCKEFKKVYGIEITLERPEISHAEAQKIFDSFRCERN